MADLDVHVVAPVRLKLVTTLTAVSEAESSTIRETLGVSDSVLSKHLAALASPRPARACGHARPFNHCAEHILVPAAR